MMKRRYNSLALCILTTIAVSMLCACGEDDSTESKPQTNGQGYRVSIQAEMDSGTRAVNFDDGTGSVKASFGSGEKVYVCNVSKSNAMDASYLTASSAGQTTTLSGNLSGTYEVGNQLKLFYHAGGETTTAGTFDYTGQDGTQESAGTKDFAVAIVTVGSIEGDVLKTTSTALFSNTQSFMRLSFNFTDWSGTPISSPTGITSLTVKSANNSIATGFDPLANTYIKGDNLITTTDLSTDCYIAIPFDESASSSDVLTFTAMTSSTNPPALVYRCNKNAPTEGFKNGRYYNASTPLSLKEMRIITVGIIDSWGNKTSNYYVHYWGDLSGEGDILLTADNPQKTESSTIDVFYDPQTWHLLTAGVPKDITGWKIMHNNGTTDTSDDTWFGRDAEDSKSRAYLFSWDYHDGNGNVNRTEYK